MLGSRMHPRRVGLPVLGASLATTVALTLAATAVTGPATGAPQPKPDDRVQIVMVDAPTVADRNAVLALGLDPTEHATRKGIGVVLYGDEDAATLREAGYTWDVEVRDLEAQMARQREADEAYAARVAESAAAERPHLLPHLRRLPVRHGHAGGEIPEAHQAAHARNRTVLGEEIHGLEITTNADNIEDGKPVFLLMGAHHAREWPSSENAMEFGFDLLAVVRRRRRPGDPDHEGTCAWSSCRSSTSTASRSHATTDRGRPRTTSRCSTTR